MKSAASNEGDINVCICLRGFYLLFGKDKRF